MAAPVPATRLTPAGHMLPDGGKHVSITFTADTNIELYEEEVTPPGIETDDPIELTNMFNSIWHTFAPSDLLKLTEFDFVAGYDPVVYLSLLPIMRYPTTGTVRWPDNATLAFYCFARRAKPNALKRKQKPTMTVTVFPTNADPTTCAEEGPVYTAGTGTGGCV